MRVVGAGMPHAREGLGRNQYASANRISLIRQLPGRFAAVKIFRQALSIENGVDTLHRSFHLSLDRALLLPCSLSDFHKLLKYAPVTHRKVGEDLPVESHLCPPQSIYEMRVGEPFFFAGCPYSGYPQAAEIPLAHLAVSICVCQPPLHSFRRQTYETPPRGTIPLCAFENPPAPFPGCGSLLDFGQVFLLSYIPLRADCVRHGDNSLRLSPVRQNSFYHPLLYTVQDARSPEPPFPFAALLGEDVTRPRLFFLNLAVLGQFEPFRCCSACFQFGHLRLPSSAPARGKSSPPFAAQTLE